MDRNKDSLIQKKKLPNQNLPKKNKASINYCIPRQTVSYNLIYKKYTSNIVINNLWHT